MRFEDLPRGWAERPITDPDIFEGVVDLVVTEASRRAGAVYLLLTHRDGRMLQPIAVDGVSTGAPGVADAARWESVLAGLADHGAGSLVVVLARPGRARPRPDDSAFFDVIDRAARCAGLDLQGRAVATPEGIVLPDVGGPDGLARPA